MKESEKAKPQRAQRTPRIPSFAVFELSAVKSIGFNPGVHQDTWIMSAGTSYAFFHLRASCLSAVRTVFI
jgi:hypothetical protein